MHTSGSTRGFELTHREREGKGREGKTPGFSMSAATHEEGQKQGVAKACFMPPFQRLQQGVRGRINSPLIRLLTPTPISATYSRDRGKSLQSKN